MQVPQRRVQRLESRAQVMALHGRGTDKDAVLARKWFEQAAVGSRAQLMD